MLRLQPLKRLSADLSFKRAARFCSLVCPASKHAQQNASLKRLLDPAFWWLMLMVAVWAVFALMVFVLEPLVVHRLFHDYRSARQGARIRARDLVARSSARGRSCCNCGRCAWCPWCLTAIRLRSVARSSTCRVHCSAAPTGCSNEGARLPPWHFLQYRARSSWRCPILGAKQTSRLRMRTSDFDPKRTLGGGPQLLLYSTAQFGGSRDHARTRWQNGIRDGCG